MRQGRVRRLLRWSCDPPGHIWIQPPANENGDDGVRKTKNQNPVMNQGTQMNDCCWLQANDCCCDKGTEIARDVDIDVSRLWSWWLVLKSDPAQRWLSLSTNQEGARRSAGSRHPNEMMQQHNGAHASRNLVQTGVGAQFQTYPLEEASG